MTVDWEGPWAGRSRGRFRGTGAAAVQAFDGAAMHGYLPTRVTRDDRGGFTAPGYRARAPWVITGAFALATMAAVPVLHAAAGFAAGIGSWAVLAAIALLGGVVALIAGRARWIGAAVLALIAWCTLVLALPGAPDAAAVPDDAADAAIPAGAPAHPGPDAAKAAGGEDVAGGAGRPSPAPAGEGAAAEATRGERDDRGGEAALAARLLPGAPVLVLPLLSLLAGVPFRRADFDAEVVLGLEQIADARAAGGELVRVVGDMGRQGGGKLLSLAGVADGRVTDLVVRSLPEEVGVGWCIVVDGTRRFMTGLPPRMLDRAETLPGA